MLGNDDVWIYNELYRSHYHPPLNTQHPTSTTHQNILTKYAK